VAALNDFSRLFPAPPPAPELQPDIRVAFILSPRFTLLAFASFVDCLRLAADESDYSRQVYCQWKIIGPTLDPVFASCGVEIRPHSTLTDPTQFDYVVVVGGLLPSCLELPVEVFDYLRRAYDAGVSIIGLCTGSFILGKAGLLENRRCAVHIEHSNQLKHLFPRSLPESDKMYIDDDGVITCVGGTSAIDFVFSLIETHCGKARMVKGLTWLLVDKHRAPDHMPHRLHGRLSVCGNKTVEQAVTMMERRMSNPCSISELASRLNTSERELNRVFTLYANDAPAAVWRKMRLGHGHWLLVNSTKTVTEIAQECGFSDGAHFSRWFRKTYRESPVEFRNRRRGDSSGAGSMPG